MYHLIYPTIATVGYLKYPKDYRISKPLLRWISLIHNTILVLFSGWTCLNLVSMFIDRGFVFEREYYFSDPNVDKIVYYFYLSKYYEFIDTFLIYLHGKKPILLQTFHHVGAIWMWHLCYYYKVDSIIFGSTLNAFIHTIMYAYYLSSILKIDIRFIKPYLTAMQLTQFFIAMGISLFKYYPPIETPFNYFIIVLSAVYVTGLIVLFSHFAYNTYYMPYKNKMKHYKQLIRQSDPVLTNTNK
jgi:hypothetical protein